MSYKIAKENNCDTVFLFDAHSDLGYGGITSLDFEVNCANWLGKLLNEGIAKEAYIVYSPFTFEKPEYFSAMNELYNIKFVTMNELEKNISISALHVCRSGVWVPPWYDDEFLGFTRKADVPYDMTDCPERKWDPSNVSLSEKIDYLMT